MVASLRNLFLRMVAMTSGAILKEKAGEYASTYFECGPDTS